MRKGIDRMLELNESINEGIPNSEMYGYTKDGVLMYRGNKKSSLKFMRHEKKVFPKSKYQLVQSPNLPDTGEKYPK